MNYGGGKEEEVAGGIGKEYTHPVVLKLVLVLVLVLRPATQKDATSIFLDRLTCFYSSLW